MSVTNSSSVDVARAASKASKRLATLSADARNEALTAIHEALSMSKGTIIDANNRDVRAARISAADGEMTQSALKRLDLNRPGKYDEMLQGILDVRELEDPSKRVGATCHNLGADCPYNGSRRGFAPRRGA